MMHPCPPSPQLTVACWEGGELLLLIITIIIALITHEY